MRSRQEARRMTCYTHCYDHTIIGGVSERGVKFTLHITSLTDLNRDVLKVSIK